MNYMAYINPEVVFDLAGISIMMILTVMVGGAGTLWGPVLGGVIFVLLNEGTRVLVGPISYLIFMVIACLLIMFLPDGIIGDWAKIKQAFRRKKPALN